MSLKISRVQGVEAIELLPEIGTSLTFPNDEQNHEKFVIQLAGLLKNNPEGTMVIVAKRDNELIGFLIANSTPDFVYLAQAWSKPGNNFRIFDEMFLRILMWAVGLGKPSIRAETVRDLDAVYERAGFTPRSVTIERKIDNDLLIKLMNRAREVFTVAKEEVTSG